MRFMSESFLLIIYLTVSRCKILYSSQYETHYNYPWTIFLLELVENLFCDISLTSIINHQSLQAEFTRKLHDHENNLLNFGEKY